MPIQTVLIVDDQPLNVELLKAKLEGADIAVLTAFSGQEALDVVARTPPDLILLDLMMPVMDGIEVCQRLQTQEMTRHIPVIFVTARSARESLIKGLAVGAVDYITKPVDLEEAEARVKTQLRLVAINREMLVVQRRLAESRRAATIGAVTQGVAHNLNNLLGVVLGYLDLIKSNCEKPEHVMKNATNVENAVQRIVDIIRQLGALVGKARMPYVSCKLNEVIASSIHRYHTELNIRQPIIVDNPLADRQFDTHVEMLEEVLLKVLTNSWESYGDKPSSERNIRLRTRLLEKPEGRMIEITIEDAGRGINDAIRETMFEPFVSTKQAIGVGMGLTVARHSIRNLGGEILLFNRVGGGTVASITHPGERKPRRVFAV